MTSAMNPCLISIVAPAYKCEATIAELCIRAAKVLSSISENYEIILINDGSPQNDWQEIQKAAATNPKIKGINLLVRFI